MGSGGSEAPGLKLKLGSAAGPFDVPLDESCASSWAGDAERGDPEVGCDSDADGGGRAGKTKFGIGRGPFRRDGGRTGLAGL